MARIDYESGSTIRQALRKRFPLPQWALFFEVANGMNLTHSGYADAIAMGLFPSRGLDLHGFEIKTDRGDWLRELKNPHKAEQILEHCDYWWLVIGDEKVAKVEEVPSHWGLLVQQKDDLVQAKKAKRLNEARLDRPFIGALLRRACEMVEREKNRAADKLDKLEAIKQARREAEKNARRHYETDIELLTREKAALTRNIEAFEEASGIKIDMWNGSRLGEAVKLLLAIQDSRGIESIESLARDLEYKAKLLKDGAYELKLAATSVFAAGKLPS